MHTLSTVSVEGGKCERDHRIFPLVAVDTARLPPPVAAISASPSRHRRNFSWSQFLTLFTKTACATVRYHIDHPLQRCCGCSCPLSGRHSSQLHCTLSGSTGRK
ncbi:hypothetical protein LWI28_010573 [Acer negundo]|uniref:Uncharacterized protein n=1 Tax=Acer negundo TaxID=4023 RepID=A0AAD5P1M1_ACENE|nr:hypothetical protein LWI28_010573 [Acer negundo]